MSARMNPVQQKANRVFVATQTVLCVGVGAGGGEMDVVNVICRCVNCLGIIEIQLSRW